MLPAGALSAAATAASRVVPPQLDVALWMLDECETPKRSRSIILDASKRLGFGETPSKKMPALTPPVCPAYMSMAARGVAIVPTPCTGVSSPPALDSSRQPALESWPATTSSLQSTSTTQSTDYVCCKLERPPTTALPTAWQWSAPSPTDRRTTAQSPVCFKLERQLFAAEAPHTPLSFFHSMEEQEQQVGVQGGSTELRIQGGSTEVRILGGSTEVRILGGSTEVSQPPVAAVNDVWRQEQRVPAQAGRTLLQSMASGGEADAARQKAMTRLGPGRQICVGRGLGRSY